MKRLRGGGLKPGKKRIRRHCALSEDCQVGLISGYIFIKAAFGSADMLTAHSFCGIPPRHQSLLSGSPIKAEGRLAARALPCLHLVNGRELTPISAERGGGGNSGDTHCLRLSRFVFFPLFSEASAPFFLLSLASIHDANYPTFSRPFVSRTHLSIYPLCVRNADANIYKFRPPHV